MQPLTRSDKQQATSSRQQLRKRSKLAAVCRWTLNLGFCAPLGRVALLFHCSTSQLADLHILQLMSHNPEPVEVDAGLGWSLARVFDFLHFINCGVGGMCNLLPAISQSELVELFSSKLVSWVFNCFKTTRREVVLEVLGQARLKIFKKRKEKKKKKRRKWNGS